MIGTAAAMGLGAATVYYVNGSGADHKVEPITDLNDQTIDLSVGSNALFLSEQK